MRTHRLILLLAAVCIGCGDPEIGGEQGALRFRFGLAGCNSVPVSKSTLAKGGTTPLVVGDPKKGNAVDVKSETEAVISVADPTIALKCDGDCKETSGSVNLAALSTGSSRLIFTRDGASLDAIEVRVKEATALKLEDEKGGTGEVKGKTNEDVTVVARLTAGTEEVVSGGPFVWTVDGDAIDAPNSSGDRVTVKGKKSGSATLRAEWNGLSATIVVKIE